MTDAHFRAARFATISTQGADVREKEEGSSLAEAMISVTQDSDPRVRAAALGALVRMQNDPRAAWEDAASDHDSLVRRRAAELAPAVRGITVETMLLLLQDGEPLVAEAASWAAGEITWPIGDQRQIVNALSDATTTHPDPLIREAAVAALGALGDPDGLTAVLTACADRPAIRRRAVLALAAFEGDEVEEALQAALNDTDWQVRQAAEDLR